MQVYNLNSEEHLRIGIYFSLSNSVLERNINTILFLFFRLYVYFNDRHEFIIFTSELAQITAITLPFNVGKTRSFATVFCNG